MVVPLAQTLRSRAVVLAELKKLLTPDLDEINNFLRKFAARLKPEQQEAFLEMTCNFETSSDFLAYLEQDENCKEVLRELFQNAIKNLEKATELFRELSA